MRAAVSVDPADRLRPAPTTVYRALLPSVSNGTTGGASSALAGETSQTFRPSGVAATEIVVRLRSFWQTHTAAATAPIGREIWTSS